MKYEITKQLTVELRNTPGAIAAISDILAQNDLSLSALAVSDSETQGRFRFTACDPATAKLSLEAEGYSVSIDEVLSIQLRDSKGRLALIAKSLSAAGINIDYIYATVDEEGNGSRLILRVSNIHLAARILDEIRVAA